MPAPNTLLKPDEDLFEVGESCCRDCPDINDNPPKESECPYFDTSAGFPVCTREGGPEAELQAIIKRTSQGMGNVATTNVSIETIIK